MTRVPLDGRPRHPERTPLRAHHWNSSKPSAPLMDHLRPASPPKSNPWTKERPAASLTPDWPTETPDFENVESATEIKTSEESTEEEETPISSDLTSSNGSNKFLGDAASPADESTLWEWPFDADLLIRTGEKVFKVHRSIVEPQSGWFDTNLVHAYLPGGMTEVHLPFCHQVVAYTLRFMYTKSLEILEYDREDFCSLICIPRSALLYIGAVDLQVEDMKHHITQVLEQMAQDLAYYLEKTYANRAMDPANAAAAIPHFKDALDAAYTHEARAETLPLRRGLASLLDVLLPFLMPHQVFLELLSSKVWKCHSESISRDLIYSRQAKER
ncbi:BTB/POZ fold protein [Metarhizium rileyi]|uniref:BTB/POZ fold protein n=1 Tax=Metarhizium rileyi (strain RCEF 4871) TaxID=1649241 RepID=A0A167IRV7_METRR|nr:BTB/POZ fold protein [Metarhizium rileyi RCEF 4871]